MYRPRRGDVVDDVVGTTRSERFAQHIKDTRDRTFVAVDKKGNTVNRTTDGLRGGATFSNEEGYLAAKVMRSLGTVFLEQQARV